jgi:hypothetical protein
MMSTLPGRTRHLFPLLIAVVALLAGFAAPRPASATVEPDWIAYAVVADFNGTEPKLTYTVFGGTNGSPIQVIAFEIVDLMSTRACTFTDITYVGGYALFNGTSSKIECAVPSFAEQIAELFPELDPLEANLTCICGGAPLWASAQAILDPVSGEQPVANVLNAGDDGIFFRLTSAVTTARTALDLPMTPALVSSKWNVSATSNRVLMGMNGPSIIALDDAFGWLSYLHPAWETAFEPVGATARHWYETPNHAAWVNTPTHYNLLTDGTQLTIGHNPATGAYFDGRLRYVRLDPGCPSL